ncbi:hypothetical protein B0A52_10326 [Exophiala mesophila]|uniref:aldehyde dehydrogenase (NAD(+)) n=1 Tax=Exophiala mesophila TaxID=212818 RepID=A0A438MQB3_EXOME|nr:hypothetical protein B0A52_10326 [Exophiala mesophila]
MASKFATVTYCPLSSKDPKDRFAVYNPATGQEITTIQGAGLSEVEAAVAIAQDAFDNDWRHRSPRERAFLLNKAADHLTAHMGELCQLLSLENGKPVSQAAEIDVPALVHIFRYFASLIDKLPLDFHDEGAIYANIVREPYGVVAGIIPFNWPPIHVGGKSAPALAAGNTVIIKPGDQAPLTAMRIIEILQEVLPKGVIQAIPSVGLDVPQALVTHPQVKKISFTGSTKAGAAVSKLAADGIKPLSLELGGKNALIVFDDADLDLAVRCALDGAFFNQGEACTASSRLLIQSGIHDAFVNKMAAAVPRLKVGDGARPETHVGPLVSKVHQQRVLEYIQIGLDEGAEMKAQAALPDDPALKEGYFVQPTLFTKVTRTMRIAREEIFGPVVTVTPFESYEEAVSITNESEYGLFCGVFTKDTTRALRLARDVDVGVVLINNYNRGVMGTPFGGAKHSGYGREHCMETLHEYSRPKNIRMPSGRGVIGGWSKVHELVVDEPATNGIK